MNSFSFKESNETVTPQLIINRKLLINNIKKIIEIAGTPDRLWIHVKTHKTGEIVRLLVSFGITKFKCATIAEAEMTANFGGKNILLAYPLVGPNCDRLISLQKAFPDVVFHALLDDIEQMHFFARKCVENNMQMPYMVDVNVGLYRTGIEIRNVPDFISIGQQLKGIRFSGLHCYDGHRHEIDIAIRKQEVEKTYREIKKLVSSIPTPEYVIMGGSPAFPCYAEHKEIYLSPGTLVLNDAGYSQNLPDLDFPPAAAILTRVISVPGQGYFTLDLGYKGIASDPKGTRGKIIGLENYEEMFQNEEHWVFRMKKGYEMNCPKVGDEFFVIPTHICPTSALYPFSIVVEDGQRVAKWEITARNRILTY